jgi:hypothetical protein
VIGIAYDFAGSGHYDVDKVIQTKARADHSLPYLLAVTQIDGDVTPAPSRADKALCGEIKDGVRSLEKIPAARVAGGFGFPWPTQGSPSQLSRGRLRSVSPVRHALDQWPLCAQLRRSDRTVAVAKTARF